MDTLNYKILASGSSGNCVILDNRIAVDCGVPYKTIKPYENSLQIILLTHLHSDHYDKQTIKKLQFNRPLLRIGCSAHDAEILKSDGLKNIDVFDCFVGHCYHYQNFEINSFKLYHDVETIGFRINFYKYKVFFATDTVTLDGIEAKDYTHYFIEANFDEDTVLDKIYQKRERGEFVHNIGSLNSHLSMQQAHDFVLRNVSAGHKYEFIPLHISKEF